MRILESRRATDETPAAEKGATERRERVIALGSVGVLVVVALGLYLASLNLYQIGSYADDAYYVVTAQSLAAGKGYVLGTIAGAPPMLRLPPGYPLLLALVARFAPKSLEAFRVPSLLLTFASFPLWLQVLRKRVGFRLALLIIGAVAVNPLVVQSGTNVVSEAPTFFLIPLLILLVEFILQRRDVASRWRSVGLTVAIVLVLIALHFSRSVMIGFVASVFIALVLNRQVSRGLAIAVLAGVPFVVWMGYSLLGPWPLAHGAVAGANGTREAQVDTSITMASAYGQDILGGNQSHVTASPSDRLVALLDRRWALVSEFLPDSLGLNLVPVGPPRLSTRILQAVHVGWVVPFVSSLSTWLVLLGWSTRLIKRRHSAGEFAELAALLYFASLLLWPYPAARFFEPVAPLVYLGLIGGITAVVGWWRSGTRAPTFTGLAVGAVLAIVTIASVRTDVSQLRRPPNAEIPDVSIGSAWLAQHAPLDAIIGSDDAVKHSLYVHQVMSPLPSPGATGEVSLQELRQTNARFVLIAPWLYHSRVDPHFSPTTQAMQNAIAAHPDQFRIVYSSPADHVQIFEVEAP